MIDWVKENPIYTSIIVTFVVSLILIITSSLKLKAYTTTEPPSSLKTMRVMGYIMLAIVVIGGIFTLCSQPGADCFTPFLFFNLMR
jgi:hypothetical protein